MGKDTFNRTYTITIKGVSKKSEWNAQVFAVELMEGYLNMVITQWKNSFTKSTISLKSKNNDN